MHGGEARLVSFLLDTGLISRSQLAVAKERVEDVGESYSRALVGAGILSEDDVRRAMAHGLGIPFVSIAHHELTLPVLRHIPEPVARKHNIVALREKDGELEIAMLDIADLSALEGLSLRPHKKLIPHLTDRDSMRRALRTYQRHLRDAFSAQLAQTIPAVVSPTDSSSESLLYAANRLATEQVVDGLIQHALYAGASVVHMRITDAGFVVHYRIGGDLYDAMVLPEQVALPIVSRLKLLSGIPLAKDLPQTGSFKIVQSGSTLESGSAVLVRVHTAPIVTGESITLHLVRETSATQGFTLESLGFHGKELEVVHKILRNRSGLVLVGGRSGSGKSTLLYTLLDLLSHNSRHIVTVEKQVAATLPSAVQLVVRHDQGASMSSAVRAALLHSPDVLMIDTIYDSDTATLVAEAANRGVLVLASIDAKDSAAALGEMLELGVSPELLSSVFLASIGTALVRKLCHRHELYKLSRAETNALDSKVRLGKVLSTLKEEEKVPQDTTWKDVELFQAQACDECQGGYVGYIGIHEILSQSMELQQTLLGIGTEESVAAAAQRASLFTFAEDALYKGALGQTSIEEVVRVAQSQGE